MPDATGNPDRWKQGSKTLCEFEWLMRSQQDIDDFLACSASF
jgi:hypothetical protein